MRLLRYIASSAWVALALSSCRSSAPEAEAIRPPPGEAWLTPQQVEEAKIKLAVAGDQKLDATLSVGGRVTFDDLRVTHVFSPVGGRVIKVLAQLGQTVAQGAPLVAMSSPDIGNVFSDLAKAQADLDAAGNEYRRQQDLFAAHAGPRKDFEAAEGAYKKAKAEFARAQQRAKLLRVTTTSDGTQQFTLRSPINGHVVARSVNPGMEVLGQYSGGTAVELFTIGELDPVWVIGDIPEMDVGRVKKGAAVKVRVVAYSNKTFDGEVDWVSDVLDPTSRTAKVRCVLPNPDQQLKPEMYATVSIQGLSQQGLAVPRSAVLRLGEQSVIFVARGRTEDGRLRFERRPVRIEEADIGGFVPVLRGIEQGETIVVDGAIILSGMT